MTDPALCYFCGKAHPNPTRGGRVSHEPDACYRHRLGVDRPTARSNALRAAYRHGPINPGKRS